MKSPLCQGHRAVLLGLLLGLLLWGCAGTGQGPGPEEPPPEPQDRSCSYFYFLWGSHAEYLNNFEEAIDAYQKALVCDPTADYVREKLPLLYLRKGDTKGAIGLLEENVGRDPGDTASRKLLAGLLAQQKRSASAIEQYRTVLSYDPDNEQVLLRLGVLLEQTGQTEQARQLLNRLITLNPRSYLGHLTLARMGRSPEEAEHHFGKALELNWSTELAYEIALYRLDRLAYDEAIEPLRQVIARDGSQEQARLLIAQALLGQGLEEEAIVELSLIPGLRNDPVALSLALARVYVRLDDYDQAIVHLEEILKTENHAQARYLLGMIHSDLERYDQALAVLAPIATDQEEFEEAVLMRARIMHLQGETQAALQMLGDYLEDEATRRPMFYQMSASLRQDLDQPEEAAALLAEGVGRYPENERLRFDYGVQLERIGKVESALEVMEGLLELNPDHAEALNFVGYTWADGDRNLEEALRYITRAMELKPGNGYIQDSLAWVHFKLGNLEQARDELLLALQLLPDDPYLHDHLGDIYRALQSTPEAISSYVRALELFEDPEKRAEVEGKIDALRRN